MTLKKDYNSQARECLNLAKLTGFFEEGLSLRSVGEKQEVYTGLLKVEEGDTVYSIPAMLSEELFYKYLGLSGDGPLQFVGKINTQQKAEKLFIDDYLQVASIMPEPPKDFPINQVHMLGKIMTEPEVSQDDEKSNFRLMILKGDERTLLRCKSISKEVTKYIKILQTGDMLEFLGRVQPHPSLDDPLLTQLDVEIHTFKWLEYNDGEMFTTLTEESFK